MKIFQLQEISLSRTIAYNSIETISYMGLNENISIVR